MTSTYSINQLLQFSDNNLVIDFGDGIRVIQHTEKEPLYYYYKFTDTHEYVLVMTSTKDLTEE